VRDAEANGLALMWHDVHLLVSGGALMNGQEGDGVVIAVEVADHQGLCVGLVFDLAKVS